MAQQNFNVEQGLSVGGVQVISNTRGVAATSVNLSGGTGNVLAVEGNTLFTGNVNITGNLTATGNVNTITGNSAQFFGDANGAGALYAGIQGATALPNTVVQMTGSGNTYFQVNFQNLSNAVAASTDYVATAGNGDDENFYVDMGIASNNYTTQPGGLGNVVSPNDAWLYVQGSNTSTTGGGNLVLASTTGTKVVKVVSGGGNTDSLVTQFNAPGSNTSVQVFGGITATGNITAPNFIGNVTGNISGNIVVPGSNTDVIFNNEGNAGASNSFQFNTTSNTLTVTGNATITGGTVNLTGASNVSLGNVANVKMTGGSTGQYLQTDGAGNLSFATLNVSTSSISNGTSNVSIATANGPITLSANGTANIVTIDGTNGVTIMSNLTVTGTTTTINSEVVTIQELAFTVADNAANLATANGAGFIVGNTKLASFLLVFDSGSNTSTFVSSTSLSANGNITGTNLVANANVGGANITASGTIAATGNITSSANIVATGAVVTPAITLGNTSITSAQLITTATTLTTLVTIPSVGGKAVEFITKGSDGTNLSVVTTMAIGGGNYTNYGAVNTGATAGTVSVAANAGGIDLKVTAASATSTAWVTQYRLI